MPSVQVSANGEDEGISTDKIAAKGIKVGETKVSVSILDPQYKDVPPVTVPFYVLDNFVLEPATILRLMPGSTVQYVLKKVVNQTAEGIMSKGLC